MPSATFGHSETTTAVFNNEPCRFNHFTTYVSLIMLVAYHVTRSRAMIYQFLTSQVLLECFRHRVDNTRDPEKVSGKAAG